MKPHWLIKSSCWRTLGLLLLLLFYFEYLMHKYSWKVTKLSQASFIYTCGIYLLFKIFYYITNGCLPSFYLFTLFQCLFTGPELFQAAVYVYWLYEGFDACINTLSSSQPLINRLDNTNSIYNGKSQWNKHYQDNWFFFSLPLFVFVVIFKWKCSV